MRLPLPLHWHPQPSRSVGAVANHACLAVRLSHHPHKAERVGIPDPLRPVSRVAWSGTAGCSPFREK